MRSRGSQSQASRAEVVAAQESGAEEPQPSHSIATAQEGDRRALAWKGGQGHGSRGRLSPPGKRAIKADLEHLRWETAVRVVE